MPEHDRPPDGGLRRQLGSCAQMLEYVFHLSAGVGTAREESGVDSNYESFAIGPHRHAMVGAHRDQQSGVPGAWLDEAQAVPPDNYNLGSVSDGGANWWTSKARFTAFEADSGTVASFARSSDHPPKRLLIFSRGQHLEHEYP